MFTWQKTGRHGLRFRVGVSALFLLPLPAYAVCSGPPALTAQMHSHPSTANAIALGNWYASRQQFPCAAEAFRAGLAVDAQSAQLHYLYALSLLAQKQAPQAVPELRESIRLEPKVLKPHLLLASVLDSAGNRDAAAEEWQKALVIDPHNEIASDGLSEILMDRKDYRGAASLLMRAPRTEALTIRLSKALGLSNYLDQAVQVLTEALKEHPHSLPLARALATVLVYQHRQDDAIAVLQKALPEHPGELDASVELYQMLVLRGRLPEARQMRKQLMAKWPHNRDVLYLSGVVEHLDGNNEAARKLLEASVAVDGEYFYSRYNLGIVLVILQQWQEAKENLQKAIALGIPDAVERYQVVQSQYQLAKAHYQLAKALRELGQDQQAQEEMRKYLDVKDRESSDLEARRDAAGGDSSMSNAAYDKAITDYRDAVTIDPDNALYHYKLSMALHRTGDAAGEKKELEEAVQLDPGLAGAQSALGYLLHREGNIEGAIEHFREAVVAAPRWTDAWVNLAAELAMGAHFPEARTAVAKALELDQQNAAAKRLSDQLAQDPNARTNQ